jgi:acyl carrier protein
MHKKGTNMPEQDQINNHTDSLQLTETENIVSGIWAEILQKDEINPGDNFFELGGDSLMTMMVMFRVNDDFQINLPPETIMKAPTLREFCLCISNKIYEKTIEGPNDEKHDFFEVDSGVI